MAPHCNAVNSPLPKRGSLNQELVKQGSAVSNSAFEIKKPEILKNSALALNRYFQEVIEWNESQIQLRGKQLFDIATQIWPYGQ